MVALEKTLILVVHGIGEQSPGETIDALTGGAVQELGLPGPIEGRTEMIAEEVEGSEHLSLFPCTIRRTTLPANSGSSLPQDQDILAAEVYWSDLSPAPRGAIGTSLDLLRTVLGLGYLALENVDDSASPVSQGSRYGVHAFVWIFYALIAPMNAMLVLASLALFVDNFAISIGEGPGKLSGTLLMTGVGLLAMAIALFWRGRIRTARSSYMLRAFMAGLGGLGAVLALVALAAWAMPDAGWLNALRLSSCPSVEMTACWSRDYQDIAALAWVTMIAMGLIWLVAVAILMALFLTATVTELGARRSALLFGIPAVIILAAQLAPGGALAALAILIAGGIAVLLLPRRRSRLARGLARITDFFGQRGQIFLSICNAMLLFWMLISAAFWSLFSGLVQKMDGPEGGQMLLSQIYRDYSALPTSTMAYILIAVAALVVIGAVPIAIRQARKGVLAQDKPSGLDVWCGRLILNPVLNLLLFLLILWVAFGGMFQAARTTMDVFHITYYAWNTDTLMGRLSAFHDRITGLNVLAVAVTALLGVGIYRGAHFIAAALGVARDISVYSTRTLAGKPRPGSASRYAQRERILGRFRLVHDHLARQMDYDRLIVVAHSQGTVIAAQSLALNDLPDRPRYLLTMGSPLTHIYGQYFAKGFGLDPLSGRLARWINIYRCDDFVGTRVRAPGDMVENLRVRPNGHTGYWTDRNVWAALRQALNTRRDERDSPAGPLVA